MYSYSYSVFIFGPNTFVFVFGFYFWTEYIRIRIRFLFLDRIYSYSYSVFIFEPNIFVFVFGFYFWTEYIRIRIRWSKYYSLTSEYNSLNCVHTSHDSWTINKVYLCHIYMYNEHAYLYLICQLQKYLQVWAKWTVSWIRRKNVELFTITMH